MDDTDRRLIALLRDNGRSPVATLAHRLKVSRGTVQNRIDRLTADGVIGGFTVRLKPDAEPQRDFSRGSEGDENDNRCDAVGSNDGRKCEWGESVRQSGRLSAFGRAGYVVLMHDRLQCDEEKD